MHLNPHKTNVDANAGVWQQRASDLQTTACFEIPYLLNFRELWKHDAVMYLRELMKEVKSNKRSQDKEVSLAKENGDKL